MRRNAPQVPPPPVLYLSTPRAARIRSRITPSSLPSIPPPSLKAVPVAGGSALPRRERGPGEAPRPSRARWCLPWGSAAGTPRAGPEGLLPSKLKRKDISFLFFYPPSAEQRFRGCGQARGPRPFRPIATGGSLLALPRWSGAANRGAGRGRAHG